MRKHLIILGLLVIGFITLRAQHITPNQQVGAYVYRPTKPKVPVQPADGFYARVVTNRVFDVRTDPLWKEVSGKVWGKETVKSGNVVLLWQEGRNHIIALKNPPPDSTDGKDIRVLAMKVANYDAGSALYECWDCGVPYVPPPPTPEQIEAAKVAVEERNKKRAKEASSAAIKHNQELADKGDAYGQFRMGERYLSGDGVEKNQIKARDYFQKSAAQGNASAKSALQKLEANSATPP